MVMVAESAHFYQLTNLVHYRNGKRNNDVRKKRKDGAVALSRGIVYSCVWSNRNQFVIG